LNEVALRERAEDRDLVDRLRGFFRLAAVRLAGTRLGGAFFAGLRLGGAAFAALALDAEAFDLEGVAFGPLGATGSFAAEDPDGSGDGAESWAGGAASVSGITG